MNHRLGKHGNSDNLVDRMIEITHLAAKEINEEVSMFLCGSIAAGINLSRLEMRINIMDSVKGSIRKGNS